MPSPFFSCTEQPNEPRREKPGAKAEQKIGADLPVTVELEWRDLVQRIWSKKPPHCQRRDDRRKNQRAKYLHGYGTEYDFRDEYGAGDWGVVGRCDSGGGATPDKQSKPRRGPVSQAASD
jgi:hypothetical protein